MICILLIVVKSGGITQAKKRYQLPLLGLTVIARITLNLAAIRENYP